VYDREMKETIAHYYKDDFETLDYSS